jgi:DNA-binding NtrC family response regulator
VLLVDDDMALLELVREYLDTDAGRFEVCTALTGDQAFVRLVDFTPDVVVLDVCLPDMNGIEIMNQIQDIHPQAHVVVLTGNGTPEQRAIALREGAVRFLEKPVDLPGFKRLLLELGRRKKEMGGLEGGNMDILDLVQMM